MLDDEEKPPPDVFSDLSTVLLSMDLRDAWEDGVGGTWKKWREEKENKKIEV